VVIFHDISLTLLRIAISEPELQTRADQAGDTTNDKRYEEFHYSLSFFTDFPAHEVAGGE